MRIKLFLMASLIYIAIILALAWYLKLGSYTLSFNEYSFHLPVMIWLILPLIVLVFFAMMHMAFYHFLLTLKFRRFSKDCVKFEIFIRDLLLEKRSDIIFKTREFTKAAEFVKALKNHERISHSTKINEILDLIVAIKKKQYVNMTKFKLANDNILFLENEKNRIKNDLGYAYSQIKNIGQIQNEFQNLALEILLEKGTYDQIKNIKIPKTPSQILNLIARFKEGNLRLNIAEFEMLLNHCSFNEKEYLQAAKMSIKLLNPDAIIGIFKKIKNSKNEALRAYLYVLAEFGLLDELREQIYNDDKNFNDFKAFLVLREKNIKMDLNQLIQ